MSEDKNQRPFRKSSSFIQTAGGGSFQGTGENRDPAQRLDISTVPWRRQERLSTSDNGKCRTRRWISISRSAVAAFPHE